mmetsp:Transcript_69330/g.166215  ORF Transcript_69330/g.166215 Transcript_69330/m.166215 type:complete len:234 (-) Transcript_69330:92-793(-)
MGTSCCKNLSGFQTQDELNLNGGDGFAGQDDDSGFKGGADRTDRNVTFRRTVQHEEIGMYMREAYSEPNLPDQRGGQAGSQQKEPKRKVSVTENTIQEIAPGNGDGLADKPLQRAKGRKGTGFAFKANLPPPEDDDEEGPLPAQAPAQASGDGNLKRAQGRKGTGFVKKENLPQPEDEEDDEDDEPAPAAGAAPRNNKAEPVEPGSGGLKRAKGRKGTGFVRKEALPPDDDEE